MHQGQVPPPTHTHTHLVPLTPISGLHLQIGIDELAHTLINRLGAVPRPSPNDMISLSMSMPRKIQKPNNLAVISRQDMEDMQVSFLAPAQHSGGKD